METKNNAPVIVFLEKLRELRGQDKYDVVINKKTLKEIENITKNSPVYYNHVKLYGYDIYIIDLFEDEFYTSITLKPKYAKHLSCYEIDVIAEQAIKALKEETAKETKEDKQIVYSSTSEDGLHVMFKNRLFFIDWQTIFDNSVEQEVKKLGTPVKIPIKEIENDN